MTPTVTAKAATATLPTIAPICCPVVSPGLAALEVEVTVTIAAGETTFPVVDVAVGVDAMLMARDWREMT